MTPAAHRALEEDDLERSIPARFEAIVAAAPERIAVSGDGRRWTFAELNRRANRVAHAILAEGPRGGGAVAFLADHSPEMIACALGIQKAGRAYLCLHPRSPAQAQRELLRDAAPDLLIDAAPHERRAAEIAGPGCRVLSLEEIDARGSPANPDAAASPSDPAVIVYTSGTTGRPKGVVKSHRAVLHRALLSSRHDALGPADRQSLLTYLSFSSSEADVFGALLNGAAVHLFDPAARGLAELAAWIDAERLTVLHPPVVLFRRLLATLSDEGRFPSVRLVALAGETVLASDLESWRRRFARSCALRHRFSSTEAGHLAVACIAPEEDVPPGVVPACRAVAGKHLTLVDEAGRPPAAGEVGELVVRSAYMALGDRRRPEETAADFVADPAAPGERTFRTGDLGRFHEDGAFEFLGRRDDQVKIRGHRIEPREVEAALAGHPAVRECVVLAREDRPGEKRLVAYVVPREGTAPAVEALRRHLHERLPDHKVPAAFVTLERIPLTLNGKVDRRSLPAPGPDPARPHDASSEATPRHALHAQIASIWEELLSVPAVGTREDFFALGGHSLLLVEMLARVEQATGRRVAPRELLLEATVERLSQAVLRVDGGRPPPVLRLNERGRRRPLFYLHGDLHAGGIYCRELARRLGPDQPLFVLDPEGIAPPGGSPGIAPPRGPPDFAGPCEPAGNAGPVGSPGIAGRGEPPGIAAMAARALDLLRAEQPRGPYLLGGYCASGLVAFEAARRLEAAGERVPLLALVDAIPADRARRVAHQVTDALCAWSGADPRERIRIFHRAHALLGALWRLNRHTLARGLAQALAPLTPFEEPLAETRWASTGYAPRRYRGRTVLLFSDWAARDRDPRSAWRPWVRDLAAHRIGRDHVDCVTKNVGELAALLATYIRQEEGDGESSGKA